MVAPALPRIDAETCVHSLSPVAGCADCLAICPHEALSYDGAAIVLDPAACTGCGHCAGVCPPRAITLDRPPPVADHEVLILLCARHPAARGHAAPVCIQGAGLQDLAGWALEGIRRLACGTGDCATCPEMPARGLAATARDFAPLAHAAGLQPVAVAPATAAEIRRWQRRAGEGPAPARRALLRAIAAPLLVDEPGTGGTPLARMQERGDLFAFVPLIDPDACTGCDACVKLCPEDALARRADPPAYLADPAACTGCLLCEDVCDDAAIEVNAMIPAPSEVPLTQFRCRACGTETRVPAAGPHAGSGLCPICTATGHQKRLFQVLDD